MRKATIAMFVLFSAGLIVTKNDQTPGGTPAITHIASPPPEAIVTIGAIVSAMPSNAKIPNVKFPRVSDINP